MAKRGNTPAVVKGKLGHFSVSQIKTFQRCPRLWFAEKVLGLRGEQGAGAERGANLHKQPEAWYIYGKLPAQEAFVTAMPGLPERDHRLLVEHPLTNPTLFVDDVRLEGYSDLIVPPECSKYGMPEILDWKFCSSLRYMNEPKDDLQCLLYGYWASKKWPNAKQVRLALHYFIADGSDFVTKAAVVPTERCEAEWEDIIAPAVRKMRTLAAWGYEKGWGLEQAPDNKGEACYVYGGCHLMEPCGIVPKGKVDRAVKALLKEFDSGLD